jgi:hypothetical protein
MLQQWLHLLLLQLLVYWDFLRLLGFLAADLLVVCYQFLVYILCELHLQILLVLQILLQLLLHLHL